MANLACILIIKTARLGSPLIFVILCASGSIWKCVCDSQNFIAIAIFIGDGLYNFLKIGFLSLQVSIISAGP